METTTQGGLLKGLKRSVLGGESFFMNTFTAQADGAELYLAPTLSGDIVHWPLNGTLFVQSGSYLASSSGIEVDTKWGGGKTFFSSEGLFMLRVAGQGDLVLSSYGAIHSIDLQPGQTYTVDTGHMVAWTDGIQYNVRKVGNWKSTLLLRRGPGLRPDRSRPDLPADPQPGRLPRLADPAAADAAAAAQPSNARSGSVPTGSPCRS